MTCVVGIYHEHLLEHILNCFLPSNVLSMKSRLNYDGVSLPINIYLDSM